MQKGQINIDEEGKKVCLCYLAPFCIKKCNFYGVLADFENIGRKLVSLFCQGKNTCKYQPSDLNL